MKVAISLYELFGDDSDKLIHFEEWANRLQHHLRTLRENFGDNIGEWSFRVDIKDENGLDDVLLCLDVKED